MGNFGAWRFRRIQTRTRKKFVDCSVWANSFRKKESDINFKNSWAWTWTKPWSVSTPSWCAAKDWNYDNSWVFSAFTLGGCLWACHWPRTITRRRPDFIWWFTFDLARLTFNTCLNFSLILILVTTSVISTFGGDRTVYRIEAVWDSSLHNSELLNKPGGKIWLTISAYLEIQNCSTPVCISRDICTQVFPRDARLGHCRSDWDWIYQIEV